MDKLSHLPPEEVEELRKYLKENWYDAQNDYYRLQLAHNWSPPNPHYPHRYDYMLDLGIIQNPGKRGRKIPCINTRNDHRLYNKTTVLYWMESATGMTRRRGPITLGGIWNTWTDALGREPQIQFDEFFAVPIHVKEVYAKTVPGILRVHEHNYAQIRKTIEENNRTDALAKSSAPRLDTKYFKLQPICEALVVIFDEYKSSTPGKRADGHYHYDDFAQDQSVLLVRTGNEKRLSAPINFESLKDDALPPARRERMGAVDVIRVPLQTGVRFVASLQLREEATFPESALVGPHISMEPNHPFLKWEKQAREYADEKVADALARGRIEPSATLAAVKKCVLRWRDYSRHFEPVEFVLNWI